MNPDYSLSEGAGGRRLAEGGSLELLAGMVMWAAETNSELVYVYGRGRDGGRFVPPIPSLPSPTPGITRLQQQPILQPTVSP